MTGLHAADPHAERGPACAHRPSRTWLAALALQAIVADGLASLRHGKMDVDDDMYLVWIPMQLDAEGRDEVTALQAEVLERLEEIKARSEARSPESAETAPVRIAAMMWFERAPAGGSTANRRSTSWKSEQSQLIYSAAAPNR